MILMAVVVLLALPAIAQVQERYPSFVQVTGRAEREVTPDEFFLQVTINERDSKGKISVESQRAEMIAALKKAGVDVEKQLKIAGVSSEFFKKNTAVASASYQLKLNSAAQLTNVWQALSDLGISNVSLTKVAHSQIEQLKAEVRIEAMKNAQVIAASLAEAIGQKILKCFYIYDYNNGGSVYEGQPFLMRSAKASYADNAAAPEESLDFKTIKLEHRVDAKFELSF